MTTRSQLRSTPRWGLPFLAALIAALAAILGFTTASASATGIAETRVGAISFVGEVPVGPPEHITAGQRLGNSVAEPGIVVATGVAAKSETAVIGKVADLEKGVGANEYTLLDQLPDMGSPKLNWKQNSGVLRKVMSRGQPIRDASVGADGQLIQYPGSFLNSERYLLQDRGWSFDPKSGYWMPPG